RAGLTTVVATLPSCPFAGVTIVGTNAGEKPCRRFDAGTLTGLLQLRPNLVIVSSRTDKYVEDPTMGFIRPDGSITHDTADKARVWTSSLHGVLARLNAASVPVLLVDPVPSFPQRTDHCNAIRVFTNTCAVSLSRIAVDRALARSVRVNNDAVR